MRRILASLLILLALPAWGAEPGRFDYWVLALSWSPAWCAAKPANARTEQCASGRHSGFVVHGLWPQRDQGGFPADCAGPEPVPEAVIGRMLPLMPSRRLIEHQWRKHGTCSAADPAAYFDMVARARQRVTVPDAIADPSWRRVERLFSAANPGLAADMVAVVCKGAVATEVRICLDRDFRFRACGKDVRDRCGAGAAFPAAR